LTLREPSVIENLPLPVRKTSMATIQKLQLSASLSRKWRWAKPLTCKGCN
jgi:hypothetical protein